MDGNEKEFTGEKFVEGRDGGDYYSGFYVDWLEDRVEVLESEVESLKKRLAAANQRAEVAQKRLNQTYRQNSDNLPYADDDEQYGR